MPLTEQLPIFGLGVSRVSTGRSSWSFRQVPESSWGTATERGALRSMRDLSDLRPVRICAMRLLPTAVCPVVGDTSTLKVMPSRPHATRSAARRLAAPPHDVEMARTASVDHDEEHVPGTVE
jgi:hypothetical protein